MSFTAAYSPHLWASKPPIKPSGDQPVSKTNDHARAQRAYRAYADQDMPSPSILKALKARLDRIEQAVWAA